MMKKPIVTFFAGVNGCGKTTMYYDELEKGNTFGYRINIDEIVSSFGDWKNPKDQIRASKIALKIRNAMIKSRQDFNQETTLCGNSILRLVRDLKQSGYCISLYYISVASPQIAKDRVKLRVSKGGHNIKPQIIERRFYLSLQNFYQVYPLCDNVVFFDNTQGFEKLFEKQECQECKDYKNKIESFIENIFKNNQKEQAFIRSFT